MVPAWPDTTVAAPSAGSPEPLEAVTSTCPSPALAHAQGLHQLHVLDFPGIGQQAGPTAAAGEGQGGQARQQQGCHASHF